MQDDQLNIENVDSVAVTPGIQGRDTTKSELEDSLIAKAGVDYEIE
jgi:hypothetical protein